MQVAALLQSSAIQLLIMKRDLSGNVYFKSAERGEINDLTETLFAFVTARSMFHLSLVVSPCDRLVQHQGGPRPTETLKARFIYHYSSPGADSTAS